MTISIDKSSIKTFDTSANYTMVESMIYYDACRPVLETLQNFGKEGNLPFQSVLLGNSCSIDIPSYLRERSDAPVDAKWKRSGYLQSLVSQPVKLGWDLRAVFPTSSITHWDATDGTPFPDLPGNPPLDQSQKMAIRLALSNEIAIIQGPPGASPTYNESTPYYSKIIIMTLHCHASILIAIIRHW